MQARQYQLEAYRLHLARQYADRGVYWRNRADARLSAESDAAQPKLTFMIDSVDHAKFAWPKALSMSAKDFHQFIRPCLRVTGCLAHGRALFVYVSESHLSHDSSWTADLFLHALSAIQDHWPNLDMRSTHVCVHADNASKECKNNTMARVISSLVGSRRVSKGEMNMLESGHSHEDLDQAFSRLCSWIQGQQELHSPAQFVASIQQWLDKPSTRPTEPLRKVFLWNRIGDGPLDMMACLGISHVLPMQLC